MIRESRHVSRLLRLAATKEQWDKAIVQNNVLQKQTVSAAQRITRGLRRRLEKLEPDLLEAIELGDDELARQVTVSAVLIQNPVLLTFLKRCLPNRCFNSKKHYSFISGMITSNPNLNLNPSAAEWSTTSKKKARQIVIRILWEAVICQIRESSLAKSCTASRVDNATINTWPHREHSMRST